MGCGCTSGKQSQKNTQKLKESNKNIEVIPIYTKECH